MARACRAAGEFLHEVAAIDEEIGTANRLQLGPWIDRTETRRSSGRCRMSITHKLVGMQRASPPWDHDAHRRGELMWPPQPERLNPDRDGSAAAASARRGYCRSRRGRPRGPRPARGGDLSRACLSAGRSPVMVTTDTTAALRAAAQRLVDAIENDETRSGGLLSRMTLRRMPSCVGCCSRRGSKAHLACN